VTYLFSDTQEKDQLIFVENIFSKPILSTKLKTLHEYIVKEKYEFFLIIMKWVC